jgi:hypothetical protein
MTNTEKLLEEARTAVGSVAPTHRSFYVNLIGLRQLVAEKESSYKCALANLWPPMPLDIGNCRHTVFCAARSSNEFLNLRAALVYLEGLPEAQEAETILAPLVAKVRELEAQLAADELAAGQVAQARQNAIDEAKAKALAEVEARFADPEPEAPAEPAKPFRGKVKLEAATA